MQMGRIQPPQRMEEFVEAWRKVKAETGIGDGCLDLVVEAIRSTNLCRERTPLHADYEWAATYIRRSAIKTA